MIVIVIIVIRLCHHGSRRASINANMDIASRSSICSITSRRCGGGGGNSKKDIRKND